ncbi:PAS domain S-box-containing protein [Desulfoluna spongiiphila]|uniref:Oxygen sensor histidine kinase NreB n=2 Tax=Desulfoluna spongiiphila TaxID=419481 RepID=A0A1G5JQT1_9BACT|nr:PAS domain S-box-containing protein [Desulfoluna spongiiphila]VVS93391.1 pas fold [Desulfoluna spongiiphila]
MERPGPRVTARAFIQAALAGCEYPMKLSRTPNKRPMDVEYILRSSLASPVLPLLIAIIMGTSDLYAHHPATTLLFLCITLLTMACRVVIGITYFLFKGIGTAMAHRWSLRLNYLSAMTFALFSTFVLTRYGLVWPGYLIIFCSGAILSITPVFSVLPSASTKIYTGIFLFPLIAWGGMSQSIDGQIIAALALLYFLIATRVTEETRTWVSGLSLHIAEMDKKTQDLHRKNRSLEQGLLEQDSHIKTIKAKKEIYRQAFQTSPNPIAFNRLSSGKFSHVNAIFSSQFGYTREEVTGKTPLSIGLWEDPAAWETYLAMMRTHRWVTNFQCRFRTRDGESRSVLLSSRRITLAQEHYALTTVNDITEFSQAQSQIKHLTRKIIQVQEEERRRIARDLHDSVAQDLSSLKITCSGLLEGPISASVLRARLKDVSGVLQECIEAVKTIAYELRPPILDELGLPTALFRHCEDFQRKTGIEVDFFSAGLNGIPLHSDTEINLYRLVQEALSNVLKHARAAKVVLRLVASFPDIIMRVEDNGVGFDQDKGKGQNAKGMGLRSMEERVHLMGGRLRIITSPGEGTALVIRVPFNMSEQELEEIYNEVGSVR